jgi:type IV secretory pathway VirB10-like protein
MDASTPKVPQVEQKTSRPPGVLPRHAQTWVVTAVALVMVAIIAFTGNTPSKAPAVSAAGVGVTVTDPSQPRIEEYRARIDEQRRKLADEQARLAQTKQALAGSAGVSGRERQESPASDGQADRDALQRERAERDYRSLFASNIAVSYRQSTPAEAPRQADAGAALAAPGVTRPATPSRDGQPAARPSAPSAADTSATQPPQTPETGQGYRVFEGTVIETVLTNRLTGSFAGPVNCLVTIPVYSSDREHLVIPQGSRVLGEVRRVDSLGQDRLAVVFHRVIRPDGSSASLDQFHGLNQIGETGLQDQVDHHYLQIFGMSAAIGALAGLAQYNTRYSALDTSASDAYRQGASASLAQSSMHVLDHYLNLLPTFTIREGHRIKVYLSRDVWLPPYPTTVSAIGR